MSKILEHVKDVVDALAVSEAPVHEDGATPRPSYLSREIVSIQERIIRGPGFTPDDLVSPQLTSCVPSRTGPTVQTTASTYGVTTYPQPSHTYNGPHIARIH